MQLRVNEAEVLSVAGHFIGQRVQKGGATGRQADYYNQLFSRQNDVRDEWGRGPAFSAAQEVSLQPMEPGFSRNWRLAAGTRRGGEFPSPISRFAEELPAIFRRPRANIFPFFTRAASRNHRRGKH